MKAQMIKAIQQLGYRILFCINSTQVLVIKQTKTRMPKRGYKFNNIEEAYGYFTNK